MAPDRIEQRAKALGLHIARPEQIKFITISDYPAEPIQILDESELASSGEGGFDLGLWLSGLFGGSGTVEATTNP
jgi:hypothetical protein